MPIYEYQCERGHITEGWNKVAERHASPVCKDCKSITALKISATRSNPDIQPFQSEGFDHTESGSPRYFRSRKHMNDELKARGLSVANPRTKVS